MKFILHGAAKEVGRSCIELVTEDKRRFLLDAGIKLSEEGTEFPTEVANPGGISAAFISHAHLDHTGHLPALDHKGMKCPIFATEMTKALTKILLADSFKIGRLKHENLGYEKEDIDRALSFSRRVKIDEKGKIDNLRFEFFDAGHIPGSASILIETDGRKILYTGDINTMETRLLKPAETDYLKEGVDVMITEATYGDRDHPSRQATEKEFINDINGTIAGGGSVVIPVFAVGRAQEIILLLSRSQLGAPVYLDGMAKEATELILRMPYTVRDPKALREAYQNTKIVKGSIQRKSILRNQGIFVTTSGMLTGGPVMEYLDHLANDAGNSIFMTGYQGEHTNGRMLLEQGSVFIDGWKRKVSCNYRQFDFSAHSGQRELRNLIKAASPRKLILNHGDAHAVEEMHQWAHALDIETYAPELDDEVII